MEKNHCFILYRNLKWEVRIIYAYAIFCILLKPGFCFTLGEGFMYAKNFHYIIIIISLSG